MPPTSPPAPAIIIKPTPAKLNAVEKALAFYGKYNQVINEAWGDLKTWPHYPSQIEADFGRMFQAYDTLTDAGKRGGGVFQSPPFFDAEDTLDWIGDTSRILDAVRNHAQLLVTAGQISNTKYIAELEKAAQEFKRDVESDWLTYPSKSNLPAICDYIAQRGTAAPAAPVAGVAATPPAPAMRTLQGAAKDYLHGADGVSGHQKTLEAIQKQLWRGKDKRYQDQQVIGALEEMLEEIADGESDAPMPGKTEVACLFAAREDALHGRPPNPALAADIDKAATALDVIVKNLHQYISPGGGAAQRKSQHSRRAVTF